MPIFVRSNLNNGYRMAYNLLKGKKGIIFGALDEKSIAWLTAEKVHEEGGKFAAGQIGSDRTRRRRRDRQIQERRRA
jgi:enoyl-[acyl-carrier-protein] reductase (NADH)